MKLNISKNALIKIILLIILGFMLMIIGFFSINLILDKIYNRPEMTVIVKYKEVPPIVQHFAEYKIGAYYRGCLIGRVSKIELSKNFRYVLFYLDIYYKDIKLPKNAEVYLDSGDLYGSQHFIIQCPKTPCSSYLSDGDIINGVGYYERIDKYLVKELESGRLKDLISNLICITDSVKDILKDNKDSKKISRNIISIQSDIQTILHSFRELIENPQIRSDLKTTADKTIQNLENLNKYMPKATENLEKSVSMIPEINKSTLEANNNINKANEGLCKANCNLEYINQKVPEIPEDLLTNADETLHTLKCWSNELRELLSKRFIFLRFMFGNPGKTLKKCPVNK